MSDEPIAIHVHSHHEALRWALQNDAEWHEATLPRASMEGMLREFDALLAQLEQATGTAPVTTLQRCPFCDASGLGAAALERHIDRRHR